VCLAGNLLGRDGFPSSDVIAKGGASRPSQPVMLRSSTCQTEGWPELRDVHFRDLAGFRIALDELRHAWIGFHDAKHDIRFAGHREVELFGEFAKCRNLLLVALYWTMNIGILKNVLKRRSRTFRSSCVLKTLL